MNCRLNIYGCTPLPRKYAVMAKIKRYCSMANDMSILLPWKRWAITAYNPSSQTDTVAVFIVGIIFTNSQQNTTHVGNSICKS